MPKKMIPEKLHHLEMQPIEVSVPREIINYAPEIETVYKEIEKQYSNEKLERRREYFIEFCLTFIKIGWLPNWLSRFLLRRTLGAMYDLLHLIIKRLLVSPKILH